MVDVFVWVPEQEQQPDVVLNQLVGVYTDVQQRSLELEQHGHKKDHHHQQQQQQQQQQGQGQGEEGLVDGSAKVLNALAGLDKEDDGFEDF